MIESLNRKDSSLFEKAVSPYEYTISESTSKKTAIVIRSAANDRTGIKKEVEKNLKTSKIKYIQKTSGGSVGTTEVFFDYHTIKITYKPKSGGMSETTLNSTITELAPAIAFMAGRKKFKTVKEFYTFLKESDVTSVYLDDVDAKAGAAFIKAMPTSSKFEDKMSNAMAVLDFLHDKHAETPIKNVIWGYRKKPQGVPATHKGDLFLELQNGNYIGVSLKAGGEKTSEPQLNTYVNKFFDDFNKAKEKEILIDIVYDNIHAKLGLDKDWQKPAKKSGSIRSINAYKKKYPDKYEDMYDNMLEIIRTGLISIINLDFNGTVAYIEKQILKSDNEVPLLVVKAYGTSYKFVTDEDALAIFLPKATSIKAYASSSSKQNWHIDLTTKNRETITMNMSVRSNKAPPENKVAQGFNLAIKFNGIS